MADAQQSIINQSINHAAFMSPQAKAAACGASPLQAGPRRRRPDHADMSQSEQWAQVFSKWLWPQPQPVVESAVQRRWSAFRAANDITPGEDDGGEGGGSISLRLIRFPEKLSSAGNLWGHAISKKHVRKLR